MSPNTQSGRRSGGPPGRRGGGRSGGKPTTPKSHAAIEPLHPTDIPPDIETFQHWNLGDAIQKTIADMGITSPTPIQRLAIQPVLDGRDVIAKAETGTGKTLAFGAPMMAKIDPARSSVLALALCPTRELAEQVQKVLAVLGEARGVKTALIVGGEPMEPQVRALQSGAQVVVGTPGRILDLYRQKFLSFPWTEFAILDEADVMLEIGFIDDVKLILSYMPDERQTLLFSATFPPELLRLAREYTKNPAEVATSSGVKTVDTIRQSWMTVDEDDQALALIRVIEQTEPDDVLLVFCNRRGDVDRLMRRLERMPFSVKALHGGYDQEARFRVMSAFRTGEVKALVATDVASRGLDVKHVSHVVNLGSPQDVTDYTHRIGRTGRAGRSGFAITIVSGKDMHKWKRVLHDATWAIPEVDPPSSTRSRGPRRDERPRRGPDESDSRSAATQDRGAPVERAPAQEPREQEPVREPRREREPARARDARPERGPVREREARQERDPAPVREPRQDRDRGPVRAREDAGREAPRPRPERETSAPARRERPMTERAETGRERPDRTGNDRSGAARDERAPRERQERGREGRVEEPRAPLGRARDDRWPEDRSEERTPPRENLAEWDPRDGRSGGSPAGSAPTQREHGDRGARGHARAPRREDAAPAPRAERAPARRDADVSSSRDARGNAPAPQRRDAPARDAKPRTRDGDPMQRSGFERERPPARDPRPLDEYDRAHDRAKRDDRKGKRAPEGRERAPEPRTREPRADADRPRAPRTERDPEARRSPRAEDTADAPRETRASSTPRVHEPARGAGASETLSHPPRERRPTAKDGPRRRREPATAGPNDAAPPARAEAARPESVREESTRPAPVKPESTRRESARPESARPAPTRPASEPRKHRQPDRSAPPTSGEGSGFGNGL